MTGHERIQHTHTNFFNTRQKQIMWFWRNVMSRNTVLNYNEETNTENVDTFRNFRSWIINRHVLPHDAILQLWCTSHLWSRSKGRTMFVNKWICRSLILVSRVIIEVKQLWSNWSSCTTMLILCSAFAGSFHPLPFWNASAIILL